MPPSSMRCPQCEHTHPLQQVGRRRPGAGQVLNQELRPVAVFLLDGCKQTEAQSRGLRNTNNRSVESEHAAVLLCRRKLLIKVERRHQRTACTSRCMQIQTQAHSFHSFSRHILIFLITTADVKDFNNEFHHFSANDVRNIQCFFAFFSWKSL